MLVYLEHFAVAVGAISGPLAAGGKRVDLFGVIALALVSAVGGGTVRDLLLNVRPFWLERSEFILNGSLAAVVVFFLARRWHPPRWLLEIADAFGLALFTVIGAAKALQLGVGGVNAVVMGVVTGVAGGIFRDLLIGEIPLVFRKEIYLYATAAFCGVVLFVALESLAPGENLNRLAGMGLCLSLRLAAIRWKIALPVYGGEDDGPRRP